MLSFLYTAPFKLIKYLLLLPHPRMYMNYLLVGEKYDDSLRKTRI